MRMSSDPDAVLRIAAPLLVALVAVGGWELAFRMTEVPIYLFPKPSDIAVSLAQNYPELLRALLMTLRTTLQAFAIAVVLGTLTAFIFAQSRIIEISLFPFAVLLQVTPIIAIAPLLIILINNTQASLTACAALVALFPIISNTTLGLRSVDPGLSSYFRMNKAGRLKTLLRLQIPSALPYFFGGLRISSGLALIGAVAAEFVAGTGGQSSGLAYDILDAGFRLDIPRMFAALMLISLTGVALFSVMLVISRAALSGWHESELKADA